GIVDGDHCLGLAGELALDVSEADVQRLAVHVGEDAPRAAVHDGVGGGDERDGWDDHFIAGADAGQQRRQVQRGGRAVQPDRVGRADVFGKLRLELRRFRSQADPPALENLRNGVAFFLAHRRAKYRYHDIVPRALAVVRSKTSDLKSEI